ncbi:hypothetical protein ICN10_04490 [Polynucleobacter sp. 86C-FISCH]|uniref:hypothetical protein n=1 Tax=Polynucleobacter sp. 86C-FISCH TaxID=2689101 RepID=UPI001C0B4D0B|nr:hypothetical protein [Polynucleobacter sp. 86C-FISCH]MBU3595662.1 hypothetical protein [Polynucleobacter sp. 86C-FISCH]
MNPINQINLNSAQQLLLKRLIEHEVIFLVIGGQAVCSYTSHRQTRDLDILLSKSKTNVEKVVKAFRLETVKSFSGLPLSRELTKPNKLIPYPKVGVEKEADLLSSIEGINFGKCFQNSKKAIFNGMEARVPSVSDLIEMKKISSLTKNFKARKQDQEDIDELMKLIAS